MRKVIPILLLLAAALIGLSSCEGHFIDPNALEMLADIGGLGLGGGGRGGGNDGIRLFAGRPSSGGGRVEFILNTTQSLSRSDFELTIDGDVITIAQSASEKINTNNRTMKQMLGFYSPTLTDGTSYNVRIEYSGSAVPAFTRQGTVTCEPY